MHRKLLIIDDEKIWLGSANFTRDSLKSHDNLVLAFSCPPLAQKLSQLQLPFQRVWMVGNQKVEYWSLPEDKPEALERILNLIHETKKTLRVAMFTWTHPALTDAVIKASLRGVKVEVVMDAGQACGVCKKWMTQLITAHVPLRFNQGSPMFHYKFALFDQKILAAGSANWTKAAFTKNEECFLILHDLTQEQSDRMDKLWKVIRAKSSEDAIEFTQKEWKEAA